MADLSSEKQKLLGGYLQKACEGDTEYSWLHRLALAAGYMKVGAAGDRVPVTVVQLARRRGVSVRTVRVWIQDGLPVMQEAHGNKPALFDVFSYFRWKEDRESLDRAIRDDEKDPLLAGTGGVKSAALEAYRREKTREARRNNEIAEGQLLETEVVAVRLAEIGQVFRAKAERLSRRFGADVGEAIRKMIDKAQAAWERALPVRQAAPADKIEKRTLPAPVERAVPADKMEEPIVPVGKVERKVKKKAKEEPKKRDKLGRFIPAKKRVVPAGKTKKKKPAPKRTRVHKSTPDHVEPEKQKAKQPTKHPRRHARRSGRQIRTRY